MSVNVHHFATPRQWSEAVSQEILAALGQTIANSGRAVMAVPGGRTPLDILPHVLSHNLNWDRVTWTLTDERWVEPGHPDSNQTQTLNLLSALPASPAFVGLKTGHATPEEGLAEASQRIEPLLPLTCAFVGMGEDGHIASLFPGQPLQGGILQVGQNTYHPRISMTLDTLLGAEHVIVATQGDAKRAVIDQARTTQCDLPIAKLLHQNHRRMSVLSC